MYRFCDFCLKFLAISKKDWREMDTNTNFVELLHKGGKREVQQISERDPHKVMDSLGTAIAFRFFSGSASKKKNVSGWYYQGRYVPYEKYSAEFNVSKEAVEASVQRFKKLGYVGLVCVDEKTYYLIGKEDFYTQKSDVS